MVCQRDDLTEIDPVTAIQDLITDIADLDGVLNGIKQSLISQLEVALRFVNDDRTSNDFISCVRMDTFAALVNIFENRGFLTDELADDLIQQAQVIKDSIGCSSSGAAAADITRSSASSHSSIDSENTNIPSTMVLPH